MKLTIYHLFRDILFSLFLLVAIKQFLRPFTRIVGRLLHFCYRPIAVWTVFSEKCLSVVMKKKTGMIR